MSNGGNCLIIYNLLYVEILGEEGWSNSVVDQARVTFVAFLAKLYLNSASCQQENKY